MSGPLDGVVDAAVALVAYYDSGAPFELDEHVAALRTALTEWVEATTGERIEEEAFWRKQAVLFPDAVQIVEPNADGSYTL